MIGDGCVKKGQGKGTNASDSFRFFALLKARPTKLFAYGFIMAFVGCTAFLAFNPSGNGSPWFNSLFTSYSFSSSIAPYRSHFNNLISRFFPNSTFSLIDDKPFGSGEFGSRKGAVFLATPPLSAGSVSELERNGAASKNRTEAKPVSKKDESFSNISANGVNRTTEGVTSLGSMNQVSRSNSVGNELGSSAKDGSFEKKQPLNQTGKNHTAIQVSGKNLSGTELEQEKRIPESNSSGKGLPSKGITSNVPKESKSENVASVGSGNQSSRKKMSPSPVQSKEQTATEVRDQTKSPAEFTEHPATSKAMKAPAAQTLNDSGKMAADWIKGMASCDIFHGKWVKDDSYPLYSEGSCPHIDEPFDCFLNGRPDQAYQKFRWQPDGCKIPRFNALDLLERLRGKRLVFVGDSLNRNMWESLVCALKNSVKNKKKVFEASGRHKFRTEGSYSFLFKDYNCTVEFFRSPFLVQEWEVPDSNGKKKETLRLDIIERSSSRYKDANILVFNTGHWWTHEKTSKGRDYYQEGNNVYSELNVVEAFHKALHTWAKWVDANVNPNKTFIIFRGYSASHFRGGQWNSGGACDRETEPIMNEKYLSPYPLKMRVLETVLNGMKTPVSYLNITRMTDFRKDAHPSIYRKQNLTDEERREPERFQDCSHWCLPGVPDSWNELLYAQILVRQHQTPNW